MVSKHLSTRRLIGSLTVATALALVAVAVFVWWPSGSPGNGRLAPPGPFAGDQDFAEVISQMEYEFSTKVDGSVSAPNRAGRFRVQLGPSGLKLEPRIYEDAPGWTLSMKLAGYARKDTSFPAPNFEPPTARGHRAELRSAGLTQWYVNTDEGLEQGFDILRRPDGDGALSVKLAVAGLTPSVSPSGESILLSAGAAPVLEYSKLVVTDARGVSVPSRMDVDGAAIKLHVDDQDAEYPLVIDPLIGPYEWWTDGTRQAGAEFGTAVEIAGDTNGDGYVDIAIGAPGFDTGNADAGRVFLFLGTAAGPSAEAVATVSGDDVAGARFGQSLAPAGDVDGDGMADLLVGAPGVFTTVTYGGAAFLYRGSSTGLQPVATWSHSEPQGGAEFGRAIASAGDVNADGDLDVVIGAPRFDEGAVVDTGRVYVFLGAAGAYQSSPWTSSGGSLEQAGAQYGHSVAGLGSVDGVDPDTNSYADIAVGAPYYDSPSNADAGRVDVYLGSAAGPAAEPEWASSGDDEVDARLGTAVAEARDLTGDGNPDLLAGAPGFQPDGVTINNEYGKVYLFGSWNPGSGFATTPAWSLEGTSSYQRELGASVRNVGDTNEDGLDDIAVGLPGYRAGNWFDSGAVRTYAGTGSGIGTLLAFHMSPGQTGSRFAQSLSAGADLNGDGRSDFLIGMPLHDETDGTSSIVDSGAAVVFYSGIDYGWLGFGLDGGDINQDGYDDLLAGGIRYDNGDGNLGRAWFFPGSATGLSYTPQSYAIGDSEPETWFGHTVRNVGDVTGDGYPDILVGAPLQGPANKGRIHLFAGSASGFGEKIWTYQYLPHGLGRFGGKVVGSGDLNGDGFIDLVATATVNLTGCTNSGQALIFYGSASGFGSEPDQYIVPATCLDYYGTTGDVLADVNGDGFDDLALGAPLADTTQGIDAGIVDIFYGGPSGVPVTPDLTLERTTAGLLSFGRAVNGVGDVNNDSYPDLVIIGDTPYTSTGRGHGYLYLGGPSGLSPSPTEEFWGLQTASNHILGRPRPAGDVNNDGYGDFIVGSYLQLRAYLFLGDSNGMKPKWAWETRGPASIVNALGENLTSHDFNGDGLSDVAISAHRGGNWAGGVYVYMGNGGPDLFEDAIANDYQCPDPDLDDVCYDDDNCPIAPNPGQEDADSDGIGDPCEDADADGVADFADGCQSGETGWTSTALTDHDGDGCRDSTEDADDDNDGIADASDACPFGDVGWTVPPSVDTDGDGCRDAEDTDDDNDGVSDPFDPLPLSAGSCGDQDGDACDDCWAVAQCYGSCEAAGAPGLHTLFKASAPTQDPFVTSVAGGYAFRIEGLYDGDPTHAVTLTLEDDAYLSTDNTAAEAYLAGRAKVTDLGGGPGTLNEIWTLTMPFTIIGQGDSASGTAGPSEEMLPGFQPAFITDAWRYLQVGEATLRSPATDDVVLLTPAASDPRPQLGSAGNGVNLGCGLRHEFDFQRNNGDGTSHSGTGEIRLELIPVSGSEET